MTTDYSPDDESDADSSVESDPDLTSSTNARWTYLGSVMAIIITVTFLVMVGAGVFGIASLSSIPAPWFYVLALLVLTAGGWTFGDDLVEAWRNR